MDTIKQQLVETVISGLDKAGFKFSGIVVSYPKVPAHGDYTTNAAMILAKSMGEQPMAMASKLAAALNQEKFITSGQASVEIAEPGFINFKLSPSFVSQKVGEILSVKGDYGQSKLGQGKKIQVEFISANPTGPLTIGNGRGGFFGDVLGNLYAKCGYQVTKEYYINDAGKQVEALGHSVLKDDEAVYKGGYIDELHKKFKGKKDVFKIGQQAAREILKNILKKTIEREMRIKFDVWFSEDRELRKTGKVAEVITCLKKEKLIYEKDGAWWFKSSDYGDSRDRVLVKSNGETTYLAQDFAYLNNKFRERKFDKVIYVWGADHHGDVAGLLNAAKVLGFEDRAEIILLQFVKLIKDGKEVRMSKRAGNYITMSELISMVGHDVARFMFLMYSPTTHIDFDLNLAQKKSDKNPVYYLQYAFARICSLLNQPETVKIKKLKKSVLLTCNDELALAKEILKWPEIIEEAALNQRVQLITSYALSLANLFHNFYDKCRVINHAEVNISRVGLIKLTKKILLEVLKTIGVSSPKNM